MNAGDSRTAAIEIRDVDLLFGPRAAHAAALEQLDAGQDREAIQTATGIVVGVSGANLSVANGEISVLMGLSGSGKSSLLRCVNGLNVVTRGAIDIRIGDDWQQVAGLRGGALRQLRRQHLAMVFQQFALLPWATVRDNIGFGLSVRGESKAAITEAVDHQLALVHLQDWADRPIQSLSGGMQQRVGLARAFATDADILLMDEPFSALDPLIREHLQDELLTLQQNLQKTILFVSHDLDEALKIGNRISIMEGGRIVQSGSATDIVFSPASDYVKRFVANINPLSVLDAGTVMRRLPASGMVSINETSSCTVPQPDDRSLLIDGQRYPLQSHENGPVAAPGIACVPASLSIRDLLRQSSESSLPILVMRESQFAGIVTRADIITVLSKGAEAFDRKSA